MRLKSALREICFPSVMTGEAAMLMALQRQYDDSQWWSAKKLEMEQFRQITILAEHATRTVPFHAARLKAAGFVSGKPMTPEIWRRVPVLTRDEVRDHGELLHAHEYPPSFGGSSIATSGGSTGIPVRVLKTALDGLLWQAAHLREFDWCGIDPSLEIANLRGAGTSLEILRKDPASFEDAGGLIVKDWGNPASLFWKTGPMGLLLPHEPLSIQAEFLLQRRPGYLIMRPSGLRLLLAYFQEQALTLDSLRSVWTMSETVDDSLRELCREIFGCEILSNYTSNETGYIAIQCPLGTNYHVVSESVLVEVVNEKGDACESGEVGRVLVTPLHNFAMPLLRYQVGDEAEVGPPCACGRGLPSLTRIVGRLEDYLILESGERRRVEIHHYKISSIRSIREFQLVQTSLSSIELRLVISKKLDQKEKKVLQEMMKKAFGDYLDWSLVFVDCLPRTSAGKLRQFVSDIQKN